MKDIKKIVACPICKHKLIMRDSKFICFTHGEFPITERGIPILFKDLNDRIFQDGKETYSDEKRNKRIIYIKKNIFRKPKLLWGKTLHDELKERYVDKSSEDKIILNIGSGHESAFKKENLVNLDIYPHWNTDIAGDAHDLPILDNSVDIVWLCAVLEHIHQPFMVMEEVYRVLKPGGLVLISVPFIQYLHASPHDYFRYTKYGIRSLCSKFSEIRSGASYTRPMGTILQLFSVIPHILFKNKIIKNLASFCLVWIFSPLLLLDLFMPKKDEILSGGVCYLGMKPK